MKERRSIDEEKDGQLRLHYVEFKEGESAVWDVAGYSFFWLALYAVNLIRAELRKQSGDLVRNKNRRLAPCRFNA